MNDFEMHAGDDKTILVTVQDLDNNAVDITGATVRWRMGRSANKTADVIKKTGGLGITLNAPTSGQFTITLGAADTEHLLGSFYHEAEITFLTGAKSTVLSGRAIVMPALIRSTAS